MKSQIVDILSKHLGTVPGTPRMVELGIGDGELLEVLFRRFPNTEFVGVDVKPALLDFVRARFDGATRVTFVEQDLSADQRAAIDPGFDAMYPLQSFHDLGGREVLEASYRQCLDRLNPGGMMLNADFVEPMPHDDPSHPRRFPAEEHVAILRSSGFVRAQALARIESLGCMTARARPLGVDPL